MKINSPITHRLLAATYIATTALAAALTRADAAQGIESSKPGYTIRTHSLFDWNQTTPVAHVCAKSDGQPGGTAFKNACNPEAHRLGFTGDPLFWNSPRSWPAGNTPAAPAQLNGTKAAKAPSNGHASTTAKPGALLKWSAIPQLSGTLAVLICVGWLRIKR